MTSAARSGVTSGRSSCCSARRACEAGHARRALLLDVAHRLAHAVRVEVGHRGEDAEDVTLGRVHLDAGLEAAAQVLARVGMADGLEEAVVAGSVQEVDRERVEQAGTRAEDEVDGRAGNPGPPRDLVDADRVRRRLAQPLVERVEDAPARLLGCLGAEPLLVRALAHAGILAISLDR